MKPKVRTFGDLLSQVIRKNLCTFCGACAASCQAFIIQPVDESFALKGKCLLCEFCYYQCPHVEFNEDAIEKKVFGRSRKPEEEIGIYSAIYSARSRREDILKVAQDGGVVTSILAYALTEGITDCAVVTGFKKDVAWKAWPKVALIYDELIKAAGSKYTPSPTLLGLMSAVEEYGKSKVGIVGTPCQIRAIRKMQTHPHACLKLGEAVRLVIGLFCMETFRYDGLIGDFIESQGINLSTISKFDIKKGRLFVYAGEEKLTEVPIRELKGFVRESCRYCVDFTSEFADISVGAVGSQVGWSTVIIRSERGKEAFDGAVEAGYLEIKSIDETIPEMEIILKSARRKRERALSYSLSV